MFLEIFNVNKIIYWQLLLNLEFAGKKPISLNTTICVFIFLVLSKINVSEVKDHFQRQIKVFNKSLISFLSLVNVKINVCTNGMILHLTLSQTHTWKNLRMYSVPILNTPFKIWKTNNLYNLVLFPIAKLNYWPLKIGRNAKFQLTEIAIGQYFDFAWN